MPQSGAKCRRRLHFKAISIEGKGRKVAVTRDCRRLLQRYALTGARRQERPGTTAQLR